jgi:hypothetical protein
MRTVLFIFFILINYSNKTTINDKEGKIRLEKQRQKVKDFLKSQSKYNQELAFFIDMKMPPTKHRFFVCNLKTNTIIDQGLVAHGEGSATTIENQLQFSNIVDSHATSLGKYEIGYSYKGTYGKSYKLYGLDTTNSNAFVRNIVLHSFKNMPTDEDQTTYYFSLGCPMVSVAFFERIEKIIDHSKQKILLTIYY